MRHTGTLLDAQIFRQPHLRLVHDFLQATEAGKGKLTDWNGTDLADRRVVQRRPAAFFMNQRQHSDASLVAQNGPTEPFHMFRTAQTMVAWNQV